MKRHRDPGEPLSQELLASGIPARFAYTALDGDPQVVSIGVGRPPGDEAAEGAR